MNVRYLLLVCICVGFAHNSLLWADDIAPNEKYLDFRCTTLLRGTDLISDLAYKVTESPELAKTSGNMSLTINIGNAQVRLPVADIVEKGVILKIGSVNIPRQEPPLWDAGFPGSSSAWLWLLTLRVGDSDVASWTQYISGTPNYVLTNFRVYLTSENESVGHFWITKKFSEKARDNLFAANNFSYNATLQAMSLSLEEQMRHSVSGPIWVMLTAQDGFIYPKDIRFPTLEELLDQRPVPVAENQREYIESTAPVWERPFLLPPLLSIKRNLDRDEALSKLLALQREVAICVIRYLHSASSTDRLLLTEKLLEYYLEIIDEESSLIPSITKNLETIKEEMELQKLHLKQLRKKLQE